MYTMYYNVLCELLLYRLLYLGNNDKKQMYLCVFQTSFLFHGCLNTQMENPCDWRLTVYEIPKHGR